MISEIFHKTRNTNDIEQSVREVVQKYEHVNTFSVTYEGKLFVVWINNERLSEFNLGGKSK